MKSPFKFLDAYTSEDRDLFRGREEEVDALYQMMAQNRLILVYGQSGTGKTSLIQCGLAARFDATDWLPLFVRRQENLNESLETRLAQALGQARVGDVPQALEALYETYLRPPYLIFDQLEELFVLGTAEEQTRFAQSIRAILAHQTPCRIVFIIREEYLAHLYATERTLPTLFDRRLRVEPMSANKVRAVLEHAFTSFNIAVQTPEVQTIDLMIDNISGGKSGIQLPYLQVYLDTLYREDFARTYPGQTPGATGEWQPVTFTRQEISDLGRIENVLERFLREQQEQLQKDLTARHGDKTPEDAIRKVLDAFVSDEGTKRPLHCKREAGALRFDAGVMQLFQPMDTALLSEICIALERARLLRQGDEHLELAHDALATLIDGQRTSAQRRLRDAVNRLQSSYLEYLDSGDHLSRRQLNAIEDLLPQISQRVQPEVLSFVETSRNWQLAQEQAELEAEKRKRKQARRYAVIGFSLAGIALATSIVAFIQYRNAAQNAATAGLNYANGLKIEGKYAEALMQLQSVAPYYGVLDADEKAALTAKTEKWRQIGQLVSAGDSLATQEDYRLAAEKYQQAREIDPDGHLDNLTETARQNIERTFRKYLLNGETQLLAHRPDLAVVSFEKALRQRPDNPDAAKKLEAARQMMASGR